MSSEAARPEPIQPELPFEGSTPPPQAAPPPGATPPAQTRVVALPRIPRVPVGLPRIHPWQQLRALPWGQAARVLGLTLIYLYRLGRASARVNALGRVQRALAVGVHVIGFPAVVLRTVIQLTLAHRAGVAIEQTVFFRVNEPAGFVLYESAGGIGTLAGITFLPGLLLILLSLLCLAPVVVPQPLLHLPVSWLTLLRLWLGLGFAAHAFPTLDEVRRLADQTRAGATQADPVSLLWAIPAHITVLITRLGGFPAGVLGALGALWLAGFLFPH